MGNVLRKCRLLAARLGSAEFSQWIEWELNGYPESQPTPDYRRLRCGLYASFGNSAWQVARQPVPLMVVPEGHRRTFTEIEFREGIAKLRRFIDNGVRMDRFIVVGALEGEMYPDMACDGAWIEVPGYEFEQLTSAVKNRILDFALKIEAENPDAGEAPVQSTSANGKVATAGKQLLWQCWKRGAEQSGVFPNCQFGQSSARFGQAGCHDGEPP